MPGMPMTTFLSCAAAGMLAVANTTTPSVPASRNAVVDLRSMVSLPDRSRANVLSLFQLKLGGARLAHQRTPHPLAQLGETGQSQRLARARPRQIDRDGLV